MQDAVVPKVQCIVMSVLRKQAHVHQRSWRLLLRGHTELTNFVGQARKRLAHAGCVRIDTRTKRDDHLKTPVRAGDGLHVHNAFDTVDGFLEWFGNRLGDCLGIGSWIVGANNYARRNNIGILPRRKDRYCDESEAKDDDREDDREDGAINEELRDVQGRILLISFPLRR